ncbi:ATP-binding cassette domain-containing protein [Gilvimarinus sp. 1_MG-2023]|uniref:ATP-binding cassette domain-containing protein n=1 Tax=Gilvimarinus sp. 1_MG-2023 TaxID=3062638 RepID=UPI0026E1C9E8|nr:ATP-binding cassette domain-containing protein [Gilvimarinus sp. 1_MG-2023]MDO6748200.1 ATP-binding cassette domain-containing protein [Gilvimarinus sp. 1_MG-2023]
MWELKLGAHQIHWPRGAWVGVSGPSGCGKTQLLKKIVSGQSGQLKLEHNNLLERPQALRGIGWAAQGAPLWPNQRVEQQLRALAERHKSENWLALAAEFQVLPLLEKSTAILSGGERQRVALLAALLCADKLLILDEPVSALDQQAASEILMALRRAADQRNLSALLVSHQWRDLAASCDFCYQWQSRQTLDINRAQHELTEQSPAQAAALWPVQWCQDRRQWMAAGHAIETGPLPTTINRVSIDAHEVSIACQHPGPSSIANTLQVEIGKIMALDKTSALLTLHWGELRLYSLITHRAVRALDLTPGLGVFAQFKAHAVKSPQA